MVGEEDRRAIAGWTERQIRDYPDNDFIITSRPMGYDPARIHGATVLETRRLSDEQISTFVGSWYLAAERHAAANDPDVAVRAGERAEEDLELAAPGPGAWIAVPRGPPRLAIDVFPRRVRNRQGFSHTKL